MLWWFLILGASAAVVVSVAFLLYVQVRRQLRKPSPKPKLDNLDQPPASPEP